MITSDPNSPTAFANASATPERIPGRMFGKTTRRNVLRLGRAERARRLLHLAIELREHGLHGAHDERERDEHQREHDRRPRERDVDPDRRLRAVEREQREPGDDRRQGERQVDDRVDDVFPRKSSRTSTHAVIVPSTALSSATTSDAPSVSFSAATACGLETASQNDCVPSLRDAQTSAASGSITISVR